MTRQALTRTIALIGVPLILVASAVAQDRPWQNPDQYGDVPSSRVIDGGRTSGGRNDAYRPPEPARPGSSQRNNDAYSPQPRPPAYGEAHQPPRQGGGSGYGVPYEPTPGNGDYDTPDGAYEPPRRDRQYSAPARYDDRRGDGTYSRHEVLDAGHRFFGSVSQGLASAVEYVFQQAGRPNGYILGEDAGGAFIGGLRYGEGVLYTKDAGQHRVYWQGPSLGYDFGAEGSKTMVLVYNLRDPSDIYHRFAGVQGSAYLVGGVGVQFQKHGDIILAPIRSGLGLRLGANIGYLKYTRTPTWNPF